jgi:hypothetical protein
MAPRHLSLAEAFDPVGRRESGGRWSRERSDYSPAVEEAGAAEKRRERRKWGAFLAGANLFWLYALILAGIVVLL